MALCLNDFDAGPFSKAINTVGNHAIYGGQSGVNHHTLAILNTWGDRLFTDAIFAVQHPDEMAIAAHLECANGNDNGVLLSIYQHTGIHKLAGEQRIVFIGKTGFELDGTRCGVYLVIETE